MQMEDWISLLVVPYTLTPFVVALVFNRIQWAWLGILVLLAMATTDGIKRLTASFSDTWLKRPEGATNCGVRLTGVNQAGQPGFPSGHCTCAAAFWVGVLWLTPTSYTPLAFLVGSVGIGSMMWARQKKRCHTLLQTTAGVLLGSLFVVSLALGNSH